MTAITTQRTFSQTRDLCARYRVSERTIYRWVEDGILPAPTRINGRLFFDDTEIEWKERERIRGHEAAR